MAKKTRYETERIRIFIVVQDHEIGSSGVVCFDCMTDAELAALDDDNPEVVIWEEYSNGWVAPCVCDRCKLSLPVYVDAEAATEARPSQYDLGFEDGYEQANYDEGRA